jgi:hypothetical protein
VAKTWILDTETKGTGANVRPLEDVAEKPPEGPKQRPAPPRRRAAAKPAAPRPQSRPRATVRTSTPLGRDQVRKKSTGEIGRLRSVDARAGTAVVHWLKQGRTSTVPLSAITRR